QTPGKRDQQQNAPAARHRKPAVHSEHRRDPRHGSQYENKSVKKSACERHLRRRAEDGEKKNSHANPGIDTPVESGKGKRKCPTGNRGDEQTHAFRRFRTSLREKGSEPVAHRHQCFTMALKPASSRPFLAASAAFRSV